jgi:hypothetical protein
MVAAGLISGEWFALFVSHALNADLRTEWASVIAMAAEPSPNFTAALERVEHLAAQRAQAMSLHSHVGSFGVLLAMLALFQSAFQSKGARFELVEALLILTGAALQPAAMYWSQAKLGGVLALSDLAVALVLAGIAFMTVRSFRSKSEHARVHERLSRIVEQSEGRLVTFGTMLVGLGLVFGMFVAWRHLYFDQPALRLTFGEMLAALQAGSTERASNAFLAYKAMQTRMDITAASHSHAILFGMLIIVVAWILPILRFSRGMTMTVRALAVGGGFLLPVFVYLAPRYGFTFALFADAAGGLMLCAILIVLAGLLRLSARKTT